MKLDQKTQNLPKSQTIPIPCMSNMPQASVKRETASVYSTSQQVFQLKDTEVQGKKLFSMIQV